ncbi:MAG: ABC transporter permease [Bryobacteraceae bacterium]
MTNLVKDCTYALRTFRRSPVFCAVAVLSLALGIGANTAIFTLIDQLILRLLPVRDPQRIVLLAGEGRHYGGNNGRNALSYLMYQDLRDRNQVFSGMMCAYRTLVTLGTEGQTEAVGGEIVSGNYFPLLGVRPALGRLFSADDDLHEGRHPYAVLTYAFWRSRLAGDPAILGRTLRINDYPLTVVGVAQPGFDGMEPGLPAQIFFPMAMASSVRPGFRDMWDRRQRWVNVYGRLKPSLSIGQAYAGLQPLFHQIIGMEVRQPPFRNATPYDKEQFLRMSLDVMPGSQGNTNMRRKYEKPLWVLMGVVGLVLLIACANLASLLTARAASRQKEIAIRLAVGSSRGRMVRQLLTESLVLAAAGGAAGIGLAVLMVKGLLAFLPATFTGYGISSSPDGRLLAFTFALSLATGIAFGLVPALDSTRPDIATTLKDQAGGVVGGGVRVGLRKMLVTAQVSLSLLLLIGAGLFLRSLGNLRLLDPGFRTSNLIEFLVNPRNLGYDPARARAFFQRMQERLSGLGGVEAAGLANMAVLTGNEWDNSVTVEGYQARPGEEMGPHFNAVSPGYFDAMGIHILAGRDFTIKDGFGAPLVAVVNARFAQRFFGDKVAVGRHFGRGSDPGTPTNIEIVGVVNNTRYESLRDPIPEQVFVSFAQNSNNAAWAYVRTIRDPDSAFRAVRAAIREMEPNLPLLNMKTLDTQLDESLVTERMIATLSSVFGALATLLALVGLYGVMAYMVTRRAREIGIRMALGARAASVVWLVMREVLVVVGAGVALGVPAALALSRLVESQLYGIQPNDPASIALATLLLAGVASLAGYLPARRAAASDPVRALRTE